MTWPLVLRPREECRYDLVALGRGDAPPRPRRGSDRDDEIVRGLGGRRRVQRRTRTPALLRPAHRDRDRVRGQPGRAADRGPDPPGRRRADPARLARLRRHRTGAYATGSTSRARLRRARRRRLLRPRAHRRVADAAGRRRLGADLRRDGVRWFHTRRHLLRALGDDAGVALEAMAAARRHGTSSPTTSTTGPRCGSRAAARGGGGGQPRARAARRRPVRERGGLLGGPRLSPRGVDENLLELDVGRYERLLGRVLDDYPQLALVASTLRGRIRRPSTTGAPSAGRARPSSSARARGSRDPRPRRRRRLVRLRPDLRSARQATSRRRSPTASRTARWR